MVLADEEDHLEFLKKCGFSNYYGLDGSAIIFRVAPRGKSKELEVKKEEIEALQKIGRIGAYKSSNKDKKDKKDKKEKKKKTNHISVSKLLGKRNWT